MVVHHQHANTSWVFSVLTLQYTCISVSGRETTVMCIWLIEKEVKECLLN